MTNLTPINALNLDINVQRNFIKFYKGLGEKPTTTVRFFDRGDYFSVHGQDATTIAETNSIASGVVKTMAPGDIEDLQYLTVPRSNFESILRELLLVKNYRVEVFTNKKGSRSNDWQLEYHGSPGNLIRFEEVLFGNREMIEGSGFIAIQVKEEGSVKKFGLACVELNECQFSIVEFLDDDFCSHLEAIIVLLAPKECLLPSSDGNFEQVKTLMERNNVMVTVQKKISFAINQPNLVQDLNKLIRFKEGQQKEASSLPEFSNKIAMAALGAAITYLNLTDDDANMASFEIKVLDLNRFVHLDSAAVSALNVLPKPGTLPNSTAYRRQSILGVLDCCRTAQGHRLMAQWVKQPLRNYETLKDRHDIVQCFLESPTTLQNLYDDQLNRIPDVMMLTKKMLRKKAGLQDLFRIYQVIIRIPKLLTNLNELENSTVKSIICDPMKDTLENLRMLKQMVEQVIDLEGIQNGEYFVKSSFDDDLGETKEKMDRVQEKMEKHLSSTIDDLETERNTIKLEHVSHLGHHFRMALKDDAILRKKKHYKILDAIKGGVRFTTDKLSGYSQDFGELKESYETQQKTIVDEVLRVAVGYFGPLTSLSNQLAQIDCLAGFAIAARSAPYPYVRPKMLPEGSGVLKLKGVRHPCLELQENVTYVANDAEFEKDKTLMYLITGPNMGGKSTFIRSVGTAVLMAHVGSFVPCESATITMVNSILGRVGASDNIAKGLSTFLVEMIETSGIVRTANDNSLVIIDELGRGTSTYDGCGIAWAIAEHLAREKKCFTLFATHFHEIIQLAEYVPTVKNYHMAAIADKENFTLLYQVKPGIMDKSFGLHVARLANFPEDVVHIAEQMYEECVDPHRDIKKEDDEKLTRMLEDAVVEFCNSKSELNDAEIEKLIKDVKNKANSSGSEYFKKSFPQIF